MNTLSHRVKEAEREWQRANVQVEREIAGSAYASDAAIERHQNAQRELEAAYSVVDRLEAAARKLLDAIEDDEDLDNTARELAELVGWYRIVAAQRTRSLCPLCDKSDCFGCDG